MSRSSALRQTLQVPDDCPIDVISVEATGDCFYDCIDALLPAEDRPSSLASSRAMREFVASQITQKVFDCYRMYADAGVEDFAWMNHHHAPQDLDELKEYAAKSGKENGAGRCLWADEFALQTMSKEAGVTLLIIDDQAIKRHVSRSARRRRIGGNENADDSRFIAIGKHDKGVILHRTRRLHYNAVVVNNRPLAFLSELPVPTLALWRAFSEVKKHSESAEDVNDGTATSASTGSKDGELEIKELDTDQSSLALSKQGK